MLTILRSTTTIMLLLLLVNTASSAPLNGTYTVGTGGAYTTLTGSTGFFNALNVNGATGTVTASIISDITEPGVISLNQWTGTGRVYIRPSAAVLYNIIGDSTGRLININGADNLTIDGSFSNAGRYLRFVNINTSGCTFRFINDASANKITSCIIEGRSVLAASGTILFSTTTGTTGNDNDTINNCLIRDVTAGPVGTPQNSIYSNGSTGSSAVYNNNVQITNNQISNFFLSGSGCTGISLNGGTTDWTISGNSFFQSSAKTPTGATIWIVININTTNANNITILNNYIGGSSANNGGSAWTVNGSTSNTFYGIRFGAAGTTTASNVNGNTISNINMSSSPTSNGAVYFVGVIIEGGRVNVGSTSGNTIGNTTSTGNITLTFGGTIDNILCRGIDHRSGGAGNISNNVIGSISLGGTNNRVVRLECINYTGTPSSTVDITNNIIGSTSTANSIQQVSTAFTCMITGIFSGIGSTTLNITGNTISNIRGTSTTTDSRVRGIYQNIGANANANISNNTISQLYSAGSSTSRFPNECTIMGIFTGSSSTSQVVAGNTITGFFGTGNFDSYVQGFAFYNLAGAGIFSKNKIYNLNHSSTSGAPKVYAVNAFYGNWSYYNNQISLTNGELTDSYNTPPVLQNAGSPVTNTQDDSNIRELLSRDAVSAEEQASTVQAKPHESQLFSTNAAEVKGFHEEALGGGVYYYNTVYIGGNATSGTAGSWAFDRPLTSWPTPVTLRNNIFFNARTGGTGKHYAIGNEIGASNWTAASSNYNLFVAPNASTAALWETTDRTIDQWRTISAGDKHTWGTTSGSLSAASLFTSISGGDLRINSSNSVAWAVSGKGIAVAGQNTDYEGNTRTTAITGGCTDIGADEFSATPPSNPLATVDFAPGSGVTSTYSIYGRAVVTITWGTGGSSYPSGVNIQYFSGVNPPSAVGGNYSNSYWSINPVGSLVGATYDIQLNFGDNETYTITSPGTNTRLAKNNGTWAIFSTAGTGPQQTELNYGNTWAKTRVMNSFSNYALTDGTAPLPVEICSFNASAADRNVTLGWTTCSEINNRGFEIERRTFNPSSNDYYPWINAGFVEGHGTTNEQQSYNFTDSRLSTGKYQYRLKQIDFNGNYEYHNLASPSEVIIGTPKNADLFQNYPNPSNPTSKVDFQIPFAGRVSLNVYNITGQVVATLVDKQMDGGFYTTEFNGSNLSSGVYFYRLIAVSNTGDKFSKTMKLILIK